MKRRPIKIDSHVWCEHHCTIHPAERDYYEEEQGVPVECVPENWRPVYVLGDKGETF